MSSILKADVLAIAPELGTLSAQAWVDILAYVNAMSPSAFCGDETTYRLARIYLAAHFGATTRKGSSGAVGPVVMEAAGGLRRTYAQVSGMSATEANGLGQTIYGQQYMMLLGMSLAHGPIVI